MVCEKNIGFNFNEKKKILNDSRPSVLNWPYYEQLLKDFQDNELSHLPYDKLWADCSDITVWKKQKKQKQTPQISMAPMTTTTKKITLRMRLLLEPGSLPSGVLGFMNAQLGWYCPTIHTRPGQELSSQHLPPRQNLSSTTPPLLVSYTSPARSPPKQHPPQNWARNGHPWCNIYLFMPSWKIIYEASFICSALNWNIFHALSKLAWKTDVKFTSPTNYGKCSGQGSTGCTSRTQKRGTARSQEQARKHLRSNTQSLGTFSTHSHTQRDTQKHTHHPWKSWALYFRASRRSLRRELAEQLSEQEAPGWTHSFTPASNLLCELV